MLPCKCRAPPRVCRLFDLMRATAFSSFLARIDTADYRICRRLNRGASRSLIRKPFQLMSRLGDGILWYRTLASLRDEDPDTYPDKLVYQRTAREFQNADVVALPHTDWAFSMLRQFLFDVYESIHVPALGASLYQPVAEMAAKIKQEEVYHLYHTKAWVQRLGLGTDESHRRMQIAADQLWTPIHQLFAKGPDESLLTDARIIYQDIVDLYDSEPGLAKLVNEARAQLKKLAGGSR